MKRSAIIAIVLVACAGAARAQPADLLDPAQEYRLAYEAEKTGDLEAALQHYENLVDSCDIDVATRFAMVANVRRLRPLVPVDPKKEPGNTWRCLVLVYRSIDFEWTDRGGTKHHVVTSMSDDDIAEVRRGMDAFAEHVLNYTSREMRIEYELRIVERTLTELAGDGRFWLGPRMAEEDMKDDAHAAYDSVFTYVRFQQDPKAGEEKGDAVPAMFGGGTLGSDIGPKGCGYTNIILTTRSLEPNHRQGEIELHEWLHQIDWMFHALYGYPRGACANPDGGRKDDGRWGGDPDYKLPSTATTWMPYYHHIMQDHTTRRMWRTASLRNVAETAWNKTVIREWLVLGPFDKADGKTFATAFIPEETIEPRAGVSTAGKEWRAARNAGRILDLNNTLGSDRDGVAYAHVYVHSDKDQTAQLRLGSDDGAAVWHNGQLIYLAEVARGVQADWNTIDVRLVKGWNRFLFKVDNTGGSWGLTARVTTPQGGPAPGVRYAVSPEAAQGSQD
jgi:hypothetical protein